MLDAAQCICHASLRSFTSRGGDGQAPSLPLERDNPGFPCACFFSTWTLMPLRTTLALKHNHKADPPFPRGRRNGPETVTRKLKWRIWIERPRTGGSQSLPETFLPLSFRRAHSGVRISRRPHGHLLGPNQYPRPGRHRGYPQRRVASRRSCFPGVSHPAPASHHEVASRGAL
jgi:hypothetical protein